MRGMLSENVQIITSMRENLLNGLLNNNIDLMERFDKNITDISSHLAAFPITMPPLQVQVNKALINQHMVR